MAEISVKSIIKKFVEESCNSLAATLKVTWHLFHVCKARLKMIMDYMEKRQHF